MGIRALQIARTLHGAGHAVTLVALGGSEREAIPEGVSFAVSVREAGFSHDVAIVSGHAERGLRTRAFSGALVADLYDPFLVENLAYAATLGGRVFEDDRRALFALLARADLVLAATDEQRLFYLGTLLGRGRLEGAALLADDLVVVAPFGVDPEPPGFPEPPPEIGVGTNDVLFGGVYDWYDPELVLLAWPSVLARVPSARLLFSRNPNPASTPQVRLEKAMARAREAGWLGRSVHLVSWVPYARRGGLYTSCRAAVLTHRASLETELSFRTRVLDFLWASLPVVSTEGGAASRLLSRVGGGLVVRPEKEEIADALVAVLTDPALRQRLADGARTAVRELTWERTLAPLLAFVEGPRKRSRTGRLERTLSRLKATAR